MNGRNFSQNPRKRGKSQQESVLHPLRSDPTGQGRRPRVWNVFLSHSCTIAINLVPLVCKGSTKGKHSELSDQTGDRKSGMLRRHVLIG